jgi:hypothetical protein
MERGAKRKGRSAKSNAERNKRSNESTRDAKRKSISDKTGVLD